MVKNVKKMERKQEANQMAQQEQSHRGQRVQDLFRKVQFAESLGGNGVEVNQSYTWRLRVSGQEGRLHSDEHGVLQDNGLSLTIVIPKAPLYLGSRDFL